MSSDYKPQNIESGGQYIVSKRTPSPRNNPITPTDIQNISSNAELVIRIQVAIMTADIDLTSKYRQHASDEEYRLMAERVVRRLLSGVKY